MSLLLPPVLKRKKSTICLKVTTAIKHRNTAKEIIIYTHRVYSLLLKLKKTEAVAQTCSVKKVLPEISHSSQENT